MELDQVRDLFAAVDDVSSVAERVKDKAAARGLRDVAGTLYGLIGPVPAAVAAKLLDLGRGEVGKLSDRGVLVADGRAVDPRGLHDVFKVARDLRAQRRHLDVIRWWLEDRALLDDEGLRQGLAAPGDDVLAPHAREQVEGLDRRSRAKVEAWLDKLRRQGVRATDYRVTGTSQQLCVAVVDSLRVVVLALPRPKRTVVLLVQPKADTHDYVHLLGGPHRRPGARRPRPVATAGRSAGRPRWKRWPSAPAHWSQGADRAGTRVGRV
ncbi:hypothetical protein AB0G02_12690, partial [Actinosynnema sp. NPDC023658]|uniref:hypothetical protein n=1 Tax=Actinosynnema sp. NPDC023658 TaxID=3155465 RepID=UPI0033FBD878